MVCADRTPARCGLVVSRGPWLAAALLFGCTRSAPVPPPRDDAPLRRATSNEQLQANTRVVLLTLDGVRWQEFFDVSGRRLAPKSRPLLPEFWSEVAPSGVVFGNKSAGSEMRTIAPRPLSLPGYQAIFAGATKCADNACGRIEVETFPEALVRRLGLQRSEVAVFASWTVLGQAAASHPERITLDVAEDRSENGPPWKDARWDRETFARAMDHLRRHRPRLLYIGLLDTDEWAHASKKSEYLTAIGEADGFIAKLMEVLGELRLADDTTLLITTDHGRGNWVLWTSHGRLDAARDVFLAASGPYTRRRGQTKSELGVLTQADIRPTVERLFGLCPTPTEGDPKGRVIPEIVAGLGGLPDPCASGGPKATSSLHP